MINFQIIQKSLAKIAYFILLIIILILFGLTIFTNVYTMQYGVEVKIIYGILPLPFILAILIFLYRKKISAHIDKHSKIYNYIYYLLLLVIGLFIILNAKAPSNDAAICLQKSNDLFNVINSDLLSNFYFIANPHNIIILLIDYIFSFFENQVFILRLLNLACVISSYYIIEKRFISNHTAKVIFKITTLMWLPQIFLSSLIYGWIFGLFFIFVGLFQFKRYEQTNHNKNLIFGILSLFIACVIKQNYSIILISIFITTLLLIKNAKQIVIPISIFLTLITALNVPTFLSQSLFKAPANSSMPVSLYISMTNYRENYSYLPGWVDGSHFNTYQNIVDEQGFENASTISTNYAKNMLLNNFNNGLRTPKQIVKFYINKIVTGWGSKDYGIFNEYDYSLRELNMSDNFVARLILFISHTAQYSIYFGALVYAFKHLKNPLSNTTSLVIAIGFIGFFLYYLISEIQSRYLICSITSLLPLSCEGYSYYDTVKLGKKAKPYFLALLFILTVIFGPYNKRYKSISSNSSTLKELVPTNITNAPIYIDFEATSHVKLSAINLMLNGSGENSSLTITVYDQINDKVLSTNTFNNLVVDSYWWNTLQIEPISLVKSKYTFIISSDNPNLNILTNYQNLPYYELLTEERLFTNLADIRYIKPNNFIFK